MFTLLVIIAKKFTFKSSPLYTQVQHTARQNKQKNHDYEQYKRNSWDRNVEQT